MSDLMPTMVYVQAQRAYSVILDPMESGFRFNFAENDIKFEHRIVALNHLLSATLENRVPQALKNRPVFEQELRKEINAIHKGKCRKNWDGEGAAAITSDCRDTALLIVDLLPHNISKPDIAPTPHGEIDFDWINDDREMLTLSICPKGFLAWSAQYDDYTCQGDAPWNREIPCPLDCCFQNFCQDS